MHPARLIQQIVIAMFIECMYINIVDIVVAFILHVLCASVFVALCIYSISMYITHFSQHPENAGVIVTCDARPNLTPRGNKVPKAISLDMTSSQGFWSLGFPMIFRNMGLYKNWGMPEYPATGCHLNPNKMMISEAIGVQYFQTNTSHGFPKKNK